MNAQHQCPKCGRNRAYSYRFDTFYCEVGNVWIEKPCSDPECIYCSERSQRPDMRRVTEKDHL